MGHLGDVRVPVEVKRRHKLLGNRLPVHGGVGRQVSVVVANSACHLAKELHLSCLHTEVPAINISEFFVRWAAS